MRKLLACILFKLGCFIELLGASPGAKQVLRQIQAIEYQRLKDSFKRS